MTKMNDDDTTHFRNSNAVLSVRIWIPHRGRPPLITLCRLSTVDTSASQFTTIVRIV